MATKLEIKIDYARLEKALVKRGIDIGDICETMGYGRQYYFHIRQNERVSKLFVKMLETLYYIKLDEYEPMRVKEEPEQPTIADGAETVRNEPQQAFNEIKDDLYNLVYKAVYEAVKKAWSE